MLRFAQEWDWEHMGIEELHQLGLDPYIEWDPRIVDRILDISTIAGGDAGVLYRMILNWEDERWDPRIMERFLEIADEYFLYHAGAHCPDNRWDPRIRDRLIEISVTSGRGYDLYRAGAYWDDTRYTPEIAQALVNTKDLHSIKLALTSTSTIIDAPWSLERIKDILMAWQGVDNA